MDLVMDLVGASGRDKKKLVQLALDVAKAKPKFPMAWSEKLDGVYCIAWMDHQFNIGIFSRTGERYTSMQHIEEELAEIMVSDELIIFEAWCPDTVQSTISGWCREQKEQRPQLQARCHDHLTFNEFVVFGAKRTYAQRYLKLSQILECLVNDDIVKIVDQRIVDSMEEAMKLTEEVWDRGGEGGVLRNINGFYGGDDGKCFGTKRCSDIIKLKKGVSFDLEVIDVYEGTGKYTGNLGGLVCRWKKDEQSGLNLTINISGMTDDQRRAWWADPAAIVGKVVQVDAMCLSSKGLLREPRFKGIRTDKTEGDF